MTLPLNTLLGHLQLAEVFDLYDGPRTFSARNAAGAVFLAFWVGQTSYSDEWLYVPISPRRLDEVVEGEVPLREAFLHSEDNVVFLAVTSAAGDHVSEWSPTAQNLERLPPPKYCLTGVRIGGMAPLDETEAYPLKRGRAEQLIRLQSKQGHRPILAEVTEKVQRAWRNLYSTMLQSAGERSNILALNGVPGSYTVKYAVPRSPASASAFRAISELFGNTSNLNGRITSHEVNLTGIKELDSLLSVLREHELKLTAELQVEDSDHPLSIELDVPPDAVVRVHEIATGFLETIEVPQADRIDKVIQLVRLIAEGKTIDEESLGVVGRQVDYYKHACRVLRLLDEDGSLTSAGEQLATTSDSEIIRRSLRVQFETSRCGWRWIVWNRGTSLSDVTPGSARKFLADVVPGLSAATSARRARTLEAWWEALNEEVNQQSFFE